MVACSAFGQTYFISLFGGEIRQTFSLTSGEFGSYYGLATLASGFSLIWLGGLVDRLDLRLMASVVIFSLAIACLSIAFAPNWMVLVVSIYLLRLTGQGFMTHTAMTSVGRYYHSDRGKAVSIAGTGFSLGQAAFPLIAVALMGMIGWRQTWMVFAAVLLMILIPFILWLLRGHKQRHTAHLQEQERQNIAAVTSAGANGTDWTRKAVLSDPRFYIVLPMLLAGPFIITGMFFHQVHLADEKGWTLEWMATGIICFSIVQFIGSLIAGPLIDRYSARSLYGWTAVPMVLGLLVLASGDGKMIAIVYLMFGGLTAGMGATVSGAFWPELYGTKHLGSIRSMASAIMIFGTAASPALYGWLIDIGITMDSIAIGSALYSVLALALLLGARHRGKF